MGEGLISQKFTEAGFITDATPLTAGKNAPYKLAGKILRQNAPVVTVECYEETAKVAQELFDQCQDFVSVSVP